MTLRPDDEPLIGPADPVQAEDVPAGEGLSTADVADRIDEDPELQANRTDVEGSPTGHS